MSQQIHVVVAGQKVRNVATNYVLLLQLIISVLQQILILLDLILLLLQQILPLLQHPHMVVAGLYDGSVAANPSVVAAPPHGFCWPVWWECCS